MKKLFLFLAMASTTMFVSCGSDDSDGGTPAATSITLTASSTAIDLGQPVTLTVKDNNGNDVTSRATIYDGTTAITSPYTPTTVGSKSLTAKFGGLTSPAVVVTVSVATIEPNNSFVIDGTEEFETENGAFAFRGIFASDVAGEYIIVWDFNPYHEQGTSYPNDLYLTIVNSIVPNGTDPETGEPTFAIEYPTAGNYTSSATGLPYLADAWIIANDEELLPQDNTARAALIEEVTLDINDLVFPVTEGGDSNLDATYTIKLTDGREIKGHYSGETGVYDASSRPAAAKGVKATNTKLSKGSKAKAKTKFLTSLKK